MESIFVKIFTKFPELIKITKCKEQIHCYGSRIVYDFEFLGSLVWVYKYYHDLNIILFLPKLINFSFNKINEFIEDPDFFLDENLLICTLESNQIVQKQNDIVIYGFADYIFNGLSVLYKKRFNTQLKNKNHRVVILSYCPFNVLDIPAINSYKVYQFENHVSLNLEYLDLLDQDPEQYESNVESLVETINGFVEENKTVYLCLQLTIGKIKAIEQALIDNNIIVSRKEAFIPDGVVINASKTTEKTVLNNIYDIYIIILQYLDNPLDIVPYIKDIPNNCEVFFDASQVENVTSCLNQINSKIIERCVIKDSDEEFDTYDELDKVIEKKNLKDKSIITESYYRFEPSDEIYKMDLSNMNKKNYDIIRQFVKIKLFNLFDLDIKTCQLCAPCSSPHRSKKLNSLSNKISSFDYRCDVTCEIFKDYSIGVIVWNEVFANRKDLDLKLLKGNETSSVFIYQTTSGKWKYTVIN
jgi:hypothetical protein